MGYLPSWLIKISFSKRNYRLLSKKRIIGSNFQIKDRTVLFEPRGAWRILSESGFFGGNTFGLMETLSQLFLPHCLKPCRKYCKRKNGRAKGKSSMIFLSLDFFDAPSVAV